MRSNGAQLELARQVADALYGAVVCGSPGEPELVLLRGLRRVGVNLLGEILALLAVHVEPEVRLERPCLRLCSPSSLVLILLLLENTMPQPIQQTTSSRIVERLYWVAQFKATGRMSRGLGNNL